MKLKFGRTSYKSTIGSKGPKGLGYNQVAAFGKKNDVWDSSAFTKDVVFDGKEFFNHPENRREK